MLGQGLGKAVVVNVNSVKAVHIPQELLVLHAILSVVLVEPIVKLTLSHPGTQEQGRSEQPLGKSR
jgi:hypothetical protein